jgi:hypothetical protein
LLTVLLTAAKYGEPTSFAANGPCPLLEDSVAKVVPEGVNNSEGRRRGFRVEI